MKTDSEPIVKDLVLVGGGHSHVIVMKRFGMKPLPGVRLTLIARDVHTPYSGMLPGFVAGHYDFDDIHIDLGRLAMFAGVRLFHDEVIGLDPGARLLRCRGRPPVPYDVVSINIGSTPSLRGLDETSAARVVPVKPVNNFVGRWEALKERILAAAGAVRIGLIGAGAGGVELCLSMQHRLQRLVAERGDADAAAASQLEFQLFTASDTILPTHNPRVRRKLERVLRERHVGVYTRTPVASVEPGAIVTGDGRRFQLDEVVWVTQAAAAPWVAESGLDVDDDGFIVVNDSLQSTSHEEVFAAGDIAAMVNHRREKAGVFAVRQGKPLAENLGRALRAEPLVAMTPQSRFLSLISTGDRYAVASRAGWALEGKWVWRWKDWIDRRFMRRFSDLAPMSTAPPTGALLALASESDRAELSRAALRCSGCGSKVGASVLERVLARLTPIARQEVVAGLDAPDDAAVLRVPPGKVVVNTVDSFRALIDDPFLFGKIAANHALSDIFAMGAEPIAALAIVTLPYGVERKVEETLEPLLAGALEVLGDAGAALVGGHTSEGAELTLGFAVTGVAAPDDILAKGGMRPGERLILTKPLGTGVLFAAHMRLQAKGRWISSAIDMMLRSNRDAARCFQRHGATALTDITGFGLLGHVVEMARASGMSVEIEPTAIPALDGAIELLGSGISSSLQPSNLRLRRAVQDVEVWAGHPVYPLLFDPQTSGGLVASVPKDAVTACLTELRALGCERAAEIGFVGVPTEATERIILHEPSRVEKP